MMTQHQHLRSNDRPKLWRLANRFLCLPIQMMQEVPFIGRANDYSLMCDVALVKRRIQELSQSLCPAGDDRLLQIINWKDYCLYHAAGRGLLDVCRYLLDREGADPTAKFVGGYVLYLCTYVRTLSNHLNARMYFI